VSREHRSSTMTNIQYYSSFTITLRSHGDDWDCRSGFGLPSLHITS